MTERTILRGKVTGHPKDHKGMVTVAVAALGTQANTVVAQVEQSMSGVYWLPEVGDVVEVALSTSPGEPCRVLHVCQPTQGGQPERCWNANNDTKQLHTRSGHTITLTDTEKKTGVTLTTAGGITLALEDANQTVSLHGQTKDGASLLVDLKNNAITLSAGKALTLHCGGSSLTFSENGKVVLEVGDVLEVKCKQYKLTAKTSLTAKAATTTLSGTNEAKIKGGTSLTLKGGVIKLN